MDKIQIIPASYSVEYADAMIITQEIDTNSKHVSLHEKWTRYVNIKAILMDTREGPSSLYPDFVPFTTWELTQLIKLYILSGISQSP